MRKKIDTINRLMRYLGGFILPINLGVFSPFRGLITHRSQQDRHHRLRAQLPKSSVHAHFRRLWASCGCCNYHHLSTTPHNRRNQTFTLVFGVSGLPLGAVTTTTYFFPHNCQNRAFALVFRVGGCWLSLAAVITTPTTSESSVFGGDGLLWLPPSYQPSYNPRKWAFALVFSGCGLSLVVAATMTPEIERACSFSVVVGFLWPPPTPPPPKSNIRARFWWLWTCSGHPHLPQPITHPEQQIEHVGFAVCFSLFDMLFLMYYIFR